MKQTAVEWLQKQLSKTLIDNQIQQTLHLFEQAKEIEQKQIINAYLDGNYDNKNGRCEEEKYYKEIFNKEF